MSGKQGFEPSFSVHPCWAEADPVAGPDQPFLEHPRVNPAPSGVKPVGYPHEVQVGERVADRLARSRIRGDLEEGIADFEDAFGCHQIPVETGNREILPGAARTYGVSLLLERANPLEREKADRAIRPAMVFLVSLIVAEDAEPGDERLRHGKLGNTAR